MTTFGTIPIEERIEATINQMMNQGTIFFNIPFLLPSCLVRNNFKPINPRHTGTIMRARDNFTIVAISPAALLYEKPAATTDDVSLMAVPDQSPKWKLDICHKCPNTGKIKTAKILKKKIVDIERAISSSSASMIGAAAAMADPPQMAVPKPIRVRKWDLR